jgi:glutathione S-transferase
MIFTICNRGIKSDYYTHCHDLPPQIGNCYSTPAAEKFAADIDGSSWSLTSPTTLEPMIPEDPAIAKRDAVRRMINNKNAIARFAARALGEAGSPPVGAPLADPFAKPNDDYTPMYLRAVSYF